MSLKSEPIVTQTQVNHRLLETLRLFFINYKEMPVYHREIIFDVLREVIKHPSPIEEEYYGKEKMQ